MLNIQEQLNVSNAIKEHNKIRMDKEVVNIAKKVLMEIVKELKNNVKNVQKVLNVKNQVCINTNHVQKGHNRIKKDRMIVKNVKKVHIMTKVDN